MNRRPIPNLPSPKILYLSDVDITSPGGAQESMKLIIDALAEEFDFYLLAPKGTPINDHHITLSQYNNFILRGKKINELISLLKDMRKTIKEVNPNIIHLQMPSTLVLINVLLRLWLIKRSTKIVYTDRGVYGKYGRLTTMSINSLIKKANKVVTTTHRNLNNYRKLFKYFKSHESKFEVIYNTAGKSFDEFNEHKREQIRKTYGLKLTDTVLGFCGRFTDQKDWPLAFELIKSCAHEYENVSFLLVLGTDGTDKNYQEATEYSQQLKDILGDKVKVFLNLDNSEVAELYYAMDIFVLTSKWESFGRTAVEAMSRKNAVIGRDVDGLSEVIGDKEFLFNSKEEFKTIVTRMLTNKEELKRAQAHFFARYHKEFGYQKNIDQYRSLYKKLLE